MAQQLLIDQSKQGTGLSETHADGQSLKRSCSKGPCPPELDCRQSSSKSLSLQITLWKLKCDNHSCPAEFPR